MFFRRCFYKYNFQRQSRGGLRVGKPLNNDLKQNIAKEHNLSETAFILKEKDYYRIEWFTPKTEIDLCGHATLASAFVVLNFLEKSDSVIFKTKKKGDLKVIQNNNFYTMEFPAFLLKPLPLNEDLKQQIKTAANVEAKELFLGRDLICLCENKSAIQNAIPNFEALLKLPGELLHITAPAESGDFDCVSRSFAPKHGVLEDPVCGSGHCHLAPFWSEKLGKSKICAYQASSRGGVLHCEVANEKVFLSGEAVLYARSTIFLGE